MATIVFSPFRCTFIHIPKTGGTSISDWLITHVNGKISKGEKHCDVTTAKNIWGDIGLSYCIVRNPWDLAVSWYHFRGQRAIRRKEQMLAHQKTFKGKWTLDFINNQILSYENGFEEYVKTSNRSQQLNYAKDCNYVMKLETLVDDFKVIQEKLNCFIPLSRLNSSNRNRDYRSYYTAETKDIIYNKFKDDIKTFNYEF